MTNSSQLMHLYSRFYMCRCSIVYSAMVGLIVLCFLDLGVCFLATDVFRFVCVTFIDDIRLLTCRSFLTKFFCCGSGPGLLS